MDFTSVIETSTAWRTDGVREVEDEESEQDESISPPILVPDIQRDEEVLQIATLGSPRRYQSWS